MALLLIAFFSLASYFTGVRAVLKGQYKPSLYSRIIWFLLAVNALVGVIRLGNGKDVVALSLMQTLGSLCILLASLKYSIFEFGKTEKIASALLMVSGAIWLFGNYPAINLFISLLAHFIGGIPTLRGVIKRASAENVLFWTFFAIASGIAVMTADKSSLKNYVFALYFLVFNLTMATLALRQYSSKHKKMQTIEM